MRIWTIGDLHLSMDPRIEKPMDIFGGNWINHDVKLKEIWEKTIAQNDVIVIPGDISWALKLEEAKADLAWIDALPGKKLILKGNHDLWWASMSKMKGLYGSIDFLQHDARIYGNVVVFGTRGWICPGSRDFSQADEPIYRRETLRLQMSADDALRLGSEYKNETGKEPVYIGAMHYPPMNERTDGSEFTKIFKQTGAKKVIYGHLHGENAFKNGPQGLIDGIEYSLVSLDRLACCPMLLYKGE